MLAGGEGGLGVLECFFALLGEGAAVGEGVDQRLELDLVIDGTIEVISEGQWKLFIPVCGDGRKITADTASL